jgi:hypothetical protein
MKSNSSAYILAACLVLLGLFSYRTILEMKRRDQLLVQQNRNLRSSLVGLHNVYASHMDKLIYELNMIRNDDYVDTRKLYNPDYFAEGKLSIVHDLIHRRNKWCNKALQGTQEYVLYARQECTKLDAGLQPVVQGFYGRLLRKDDTGQLVLDIEPVTEFNLPDIEKVGR